MANESVSGRVRQLIQENEQRAAADLLVQAFQDKNAKLLDIAVVQLANIKKLSDQTAAGILSPDEVNREQAKINASLLYLSNEHARLFEGAGAVKAGKKSQWVLLIGAGLLLIVIIGLLWKNAGSSNSATDPFDLELRLYEPGGGQKVITEGRVNLRLGEEMPRQPMPLDAEGKALFRELSGRYRDSVVHLIYFPPNKDKRFNIVAQNSTTIKGENRQTTHFTLEFLPDTTIFEAGLIDSKGRPIAEADISIDGTLHSRSDERGYFKAAIPKAVGASIYLLVEKNGQRLLKQDVTLFSGYHEIPIQ